MLPHPHPPPTMDAGSVDSGEYHVAAVLEAVALLCAGGGVVWVR